MAQEYMLIYALAKINLSLISINLNNKEHDFRCVPL